MRGFVLCIVVLCALLSSSPALAQTSTPRMAVTRNFNVFLGTAAGGPLQTVTTRGTGYSGIYYPWYQWSPDGKYLLLLRDHGNASKADLLLLNSGGHAMRTLATVPFPTDFYPTWAMDRDLIALVGNQVEVQKYGGFRNFVQQMDVQGHRTAMFSYLSHEGCGGGTGDPAQATWWEETGFGGDRPQMSWSVSQGLAAYTASCAGGVNINNLKTGRSIHVNGWIEPALSSQGLLAVEGHPNSPRLIPYGNILLVNPRTGAVIRNVAPGELPLWSPDGGTLYFVQRTIRQTQQGRDELGNDFTLQFINSAVMRANGQGQGVTRLTTIDAYGLGALNLLPDGRSLVFSSVENDWRMWQHRKGNTVYRTKADAPRVQVLRLDGAGHLSTVVMNAGSPAVQP